MERFIGTTSRGLRAPIIREGDDIVTIVVDAVVKAVESEKIELMDKDVVAVTEAVVARAQGNYATADDIAEDVLVAPSPYIESNIVLGFNCSTPLEVSFI